MPWTAEQAKANAKPAAEARWRAYRAKLANPAKAKPDPADETAEYTQRRIARVIAQLNRLDDMLDTEVDPQKLDRLASAQSRLWVQYRELTGLPGPGNLRPSAPRRQAAPPSIPMSEPVPAISPPATPAPATAPQA